MDLHLHTAASTDYQQPGITTLDILRRAEERGLDIIAFTDHNSIRGYADLWREIEDLELLESLARLTPEEAAKLGEFRRLLGKILLLPGFEFTATFGFHLLAIFPETTSIRRMEHLLLLLGVPEERFGSGEVGATSDTLRAYEVLAGHGALVIGAHVNSSHGIAMQGMKFGGQTKIAYTQSEHLLALEVTDLDSTSRRSTAAFFSGVKPEYPRRMFCIQGSDAHRLDRDPVRETNLGVGDRATEVYLSEPSFAALKSLFTGSDFGNVRPANPGGPAADALHDARHLGNTSTQAFHERMSQARLGTTPLLRDIVAFANGSGGTIFIGAGTSDRKAVPGVPDATAAVASLLAEIEREISPRVDVSTEIVTYTGKSVIALNVDEGGEKPHALAPASILVRHGGESRMANRDEIVAMVRATALAPAARGSELDRLPAASPVTQPARPANGTRSRPSRRPGNENATSQPSPGPPPRSIVAKPEPVESIASLDGHLDLVAPRTGAEIVEVTERDGVAVYAIRDLRNGQVTPNVTRDAARRLWKYAIQEREEREIDEGHIRWKGDFGFWKVYRPSRSERRFNLVYREAGALRVFYGVTEEGLDDRWRAVIPAGKVIAPE